MSEFINNKQQEIFIKDYKLLLDSIEDLNLLNYGLANVKLNSRGKKERYALTSKTNNKEKLFNIDKEPTKEELKKNNTVYFKINYNLLVIDIDDLNKVKKDFINMLDDEANVVIKTKRGFHYYFKYNSKLKNYQANELGFDIITNKDSITTYPSYYFNDDKDKTIIKYEIIKNNKCLSDISDDLTQYIINLLENYNDYQEEKSQEEKSQEEINKDEININFSLKNIYNVSEEEKENLLIKYLKLVYIIEEKEDPNGKYKHDKRRFYRQRE